MAGEKTLCTLSAEPEEVNRFLQIPVTGLGDVIRRSTLISALTMLGTPAVAQSGAFDAGTSPALSTSFSYAGVIQANVGGGARRGAAYDGALAIQLTIHSTGLSRGAAPSYSFSRSTPMEASRAIRLARCNQSIRTRRRRVCGLRNCGCKRICSRTGCRSLQGDTTSTPSSIGCSRLHSLSTARSGSDPSLRRVV